MNDRFARWALTMVRWRWVVIALWLVWIVAAALILVPKADTIVKGGGFDVPGSQSNKAAQILNDKFKDSSANLAIVVYHSNNLTISDPAYRADVMADAHRLATVKGVVKVLSYYNTQDPFLVSKDRHTTNVIVSLKGNEGQVSNIEPNLEKQVKGTAVQHYITGLPAVDADTFSTSEKDLKRSELVTIPVVIILLLLVFRTVTAAMLPLILGACAVVSTESLIYVIGSHVDTSVFALNIGSLIGLGLGIDFSLIVVNRLREERANGRDTADAVATAMATAGRSITYSGITVMLSMLLLTVIVYDLMIVRSISFAVVLVAITALLAALTLLPAVLAVLGPRIEWLPVMPRRRAQSPGDHGFWYRLAQFIMRHAWVSLGLSLLILVALALPTLRIQLIGGAVSALPSSNESVKGYNLEGQAFGVSTLTPIQIAIQTPPNGVWNPQFLRTLQTLTQRLARDPRVKDAESLVTQARLEGIPADRVLSITPQDFTKNRLLALGIAPFVNLTSGNDYAIVNVITQKGEYDTSTESLVNDVRDTIIPGVPGLARYHTYVGGQTAAFQDFSNTLYGRFPYIIALVLLLIFVILLMFFQSIVLPIKAMLLNLATVLATYGALVLIFQWSGFPTQTLLGFTSQQKVSAVVPVILFVILFGLSTDYEVFILSRIKELYGHLHDNTEAIALGVQNTAGVVTAAGLILVGTFGSFATASVVTVKSIGLGLAIGVALDTTIVRVVMVPATMRLTGRLNWWMPPWLKRFVPELSEGPSSQPLAPVPAGVAAMPLADGEAVPSAAVQTAPAAVDTAANPAWKPHTIARLRAAGGSVAAEAMTLPHYRLFRIGRDRGSELHLFDEQIAPLHAQIARDGRVYSIEDLGSESGVYVSGERIPPHRPVILRDGDRIGIGAQPDHTFVFELHPARMA